VETAFGRLFALWSAHYVPQSAEACAQALRQGYACLSQRGGLAQLRKFNRPAVLALEDAAGASHSVVIARVWPNAVRLLIGDRVHEVTVDDLQRHWRGEFQLLWKPQQLARILKLGAQGEPVRVLRQRLQRWANLPALDTSDVFDVPLRALVRQFQNAQDLTVDGIAGGQTQALLDALFAEAGSPVLVAPQGAT
jgi:general secretion pathway protein A